MLITTLELEKEPLELDHSFPPDAIDYAPDLRQTGPLSVKGRADLLVEHRGPKEFVQDIRLRASYCGPFELQCARCLDPVAEQIGGEFDLIFRPHAADADAAERSITEEETEIGYYDGSGLLLEDVVREQVLLSLPSRTLCQQDCKGLCPHCGQNRNGTDCHCEPALADPRWNALASLSGKLQ